MQLDHLFFAFPIPNLLRVYEADFTIIVSTEKS